MALALALKNLDTVVVGCDTDVLSDRPSDFGQFMSLPGRAILLLAGDIEAVRQPIYDHVVPRLTPRTGAAALAQLLEAALVLEVVPRLAQLGGRIELIVGGIDPVRHIEEPGIYYLDSTKNFSLQPVAGNVATAGTTAAAGEVLQGRDIAAASADELTDLAKECLAATKLRWPAAMAPHLRLGIITRHQIRILDF